MNQAIKEKLPGKSRPSAGQARILVVPLDWGLGHATRCIPIIRELISQNCDVWLAGEGAQEQLLKSEFPELPFLNLSGYRIKYAKTKSGLIWKMIQQGPKMKRAIRNEHLWLKKIVDEHEFDAVISDNRYGLYHSKIPSIFITHQLKIKSPEGKWKWLESILQKKNYGYIKKFTACWVPDEEGENNIAGELSHPEKKAPIPVHYIGLLSRFSKMEVSEMNGHLLIILSGPEPQRSILEDKIVNEVSHYNGTATIVRGLPGNAGLIPSSNMISFYNHLPAKELNIEMLKAAYIICRSGYSSIMDIVTLEKKCILIPTPGQTEQEYLGSLLMKKAIALYMDQKDFSLTGALQAASNFEYKLQEYKNDSLLKNTITLFISDTR